MATASPLAGAPAPQEISDARAIRQTLSEFARLLYLRRRCRDLLLPSGLFGEPAWDILLDLFAVEAEGQVRDVTSVCRAACVPQTTALRHLAKLEAAGLVQRTPAPSDGRRSLVKLTAKGSQAMREALGQLRSECRMQSLVAVDMRGRLGLERCAQPRAGRA